MESSIRNHSIANRKFANLACIDRYDLSRWSRNVPAKLQIVAVSSRSGFDESHFLQNC